MAQPLITDSGTAKECRRFGGHLLRAGCLGAQGVELGAHERQRQIRGSLPVLRAREAAFRQKVETAGHRKDQLTGHVREGRTRMKRTVLIALVILVAWPPLLRTRASAQAQTKDQHGWIGTETVKTRFGDFEFRNGYPTAEATEKLYEFRTFNRAVESYLHFVTLMSMFYMQKGLYDFGLDAANKFLIFETLLDAQSLYLTPNTESVYGMQFLDLKGGGPTVVEAPPGLLGGFSTMWQQSLLGVGPTGVDKGKGGKFLLLPPDYEGRSPVGYFTAKSPSYGVWFGVRGFLVNGKSDPAVA